MLTMSYPPIYCDECATLALATLDGAPLCAKCLLEVVQNGDPAVIGHIEPLAFDTTSFTALNTRESSVPASALVTSQL
jgi:hypothetical protein